MGYSKQWPEQAAVYHPRNPENSPLWNLLDKHYENFEQTYQQRFEKDYGFFRPVITEVVRGYLKCGDFREGFARVLCPDCHHEYLLAFSCRGRWFCPSCHAKKVVLFGEHLRNEILYPVPHRQYVFSIPKILRVYFKYDRKLLGKLCQCAKAALLRFLRIVTGIEDGALDAVMTIHTLTAPTVRYGKEDDESIHWGLLPLASPRARYRRRWPLLRQRHVLRHAREGGSK